MSLLKRLSALFAGRPAAGSGSAYPVAVQCGRCGEIIRARINLNNDLSLVDDEAGGEARYRVRKVLIGSERCFQPVEVTLTFDTGRRLVDRQISGGSFAAE